MANMKKGEIVMWVAIGLLFIANIFVQRHPRYSWDKDLSQRLAADFTQTAQRVNRYCLFVTFFIHYLSTF